VTKAKKAKKNSCKVCGHAVRAGVLCWVCARLKQAATEDPEVAIARRGRIEKGE
jgi:ribosomal protein L32